MGCLQQKKRFYSLFNEKKKKTESILKSMRLPFQLGRKIHINFPS